ncbi:MAG: amidohydrolase [Actinomycetota bacterium]|nr:amidohydrolase [Actinomycetota bacterium]MED5439080.1 amidohydrolase [Actinomycetota bacterium]
MVNRDPNRGTIITGGPAYPLVKGDISTVEAVRIDGRRITHVGSLADAGALGDARVIDLDGRSILPGFVDAHTHPLMHGQCASWADLTSASSVDEVVKLLGEHARTEVRSVTPIRGFGYDHHRLAEGRHPTAVELDRVVDDRTVTVMHVSGHGFSVNSHGLAEAGITAATPTPPGGVIDRDEAGRPLGRVFDAACDLLTGPDGVKLGNHGPNLHLPDDPDDLARMLDDAQEAFLATGVTTVGDCQVTEREMQAFLTARDAGRLTLRVVMYVLSSHVDSLDRLGIDSWLGDDRLSVGGVKHYADGALTGGTAYLPCGCGATHGHLYHGPGELEDLLVASATAGRQTATHAQGPEAIQLVLDALGRAPLRPDLRHRIEHCGFPSVDQLTEMCRLGVVPVPQPTQVHLYGEGVRRDHPEVADGMYPSGRIAAAGLPVVLSSDAPVTRPCVMLSCWAAETRLTSAGRVLGDENRITRAQSLSGYTVGGAHALRRDDVGSLAVGNPADLVLLDNDPFTVTVDRLPDVAVLETWVDSRPAWTLADGRMP